MKDEPWRGDPGARVLHLEGKLANKREELRRKDARIAELEEQARRYYKPSGAYIVLDSPEAVVERRKADAARLAELERYIAEKLDPTVSAAAKVREELVRERDEARADLKTLQIEKNLARWEVGQEILSRFEAEDALAQERAAGQKRVRIIHRLMRRYRAARDRAVALGRERDEARELADRNQRNLDTAQAALCGASRVLSETKDCDEAHGWLTRQEAYEKALAYKRDMEAIVKAVEAERTRLLQIIHDCYGYLPVVPGTALAFADSNLTPHVVAVADEWAIRERQAEAAEAREGRLREALEVVAEKCARWNMPDAEVGPEFVDGRRGGFRDAAAMIRQALAGQEASDA